MSILDKIDKMLLNERGPDFKDFFKKSKLRGFKNRKELATTIEKMEMKVEKKDSLKFELILNKYLRNIDITLSVAEAIMKIKDRDAVALYDELLDLHYHN